MTDHADFTPELTLSPDLTTAAAAADVAVYPTKKYWANPARAAEGVVLVGFSSIAEADIRPGIAALARAWFG